MAYCRRFLAGFLGLVAIAAANAAGSSPPALEQLIAAADTSGLLELGKRHQYGVGAPQSIDQAIQLYCAAARLGSAEAQYRLGAIYARKLAGNRDELLAAAWLQKAAAQRYRAAIDSLTQWDLSAVALPTDPDCVLSDRMVARTLPRRIAPSPAVADDREAPAPRIMFDIGAAPPRSEIAALVRRLAPEYGLDPALVLAVIEVESKFNPKALSPKRAQGLMQLIPETAARFGVSDPWNPLENLRGGMAYLSWLLDFFDGDVRLALAGYNAGEKAVQRYGGVPPYPETRSYIKQVASVLGLSEEGLPDVKARATRGKPPKRQAPRQSQVLVLDSPG